jgi:tRNA pseudouridine13 synthase
LELLNTILSEEGLNQEQLKLKGFREMFFSRGERAALCLPTGLTFAVGPDELHPQRQRLTLAFELPRGCYATLIVKRITP